MRVLVATALLAVTPAALAQAPAETAPAQTQAPAQQAPKSQPEKPGAAPAAPAPEPKGEKVPGTEAAAQKTTEPKPAGAARAAEAPAEPAPARPAADAAKGSAAATAPPPTQAPKQEPAETLSSDLTPSEPSAPHVLPAPANAAGPGPVQPPPEPERFRLLYTGPLGYHQDHYFVNAGFRLDLVRDPRFDIFASSDALPHLSVQAGRTIMTQGEFSAALLLAWDYGGRNDRVRDTDQTSLGVHRLGAGIEARYHLVHRLYLLGRLRLGAARAHAVLKEVRDFVSNQWLFDGRAVLGAAFELLGKPDGTERKPRLWFVAEGGYVLTSSVDLTLEPNNPNEAPERAQPVELGEMNLKGATMRFGLVISY